MPTFLPETKFNVFEGDFLDPAETEITFQSGQLYSEVWHQFPPAKMDSQLAVLHWKLHSQNL